MSSLFTLFGHFRLHERSRRKVPRQQSVRPRFESLEGRRLLSATATQSPAPAPALVSQATGAQAPVTNQAASLLPLTVNSVNITGVTNNALQLVANATTPNGLNIQIPFTLTNTTPNAATPILNLHVGAIHLDLLGLKVDTSEICLAVTAQSGSGNLLGNLLGDVAHLLDQGLNLNQILGSLTSTQLSNLNSGLSGLLNGALGAIGSPTSAASNGASVTSTGATEILHLSLGPVDLNLLGLQVHLDNCNNGPVTVDISAQSGPGELLGNLLDRVSHVLDGPASATAKANKLDKIADDLAQLL
jgi:hypothetical protein